MKRKGKSTTANEDEGELPSSPSGTSTPALPSVILGSDERDSLARERGQDRVEELTIHDGEFYIDSADCVIRVDNTLFKVSVTLLSAPYLLSFGPPRAASCRFVTELTLTSVPISIFVVCLVTLILTYRPCALEVHRYFLGRDSSAFQHMFSIPAPSQDMEGCSDGNPIRLYRESVEHFRSLLSVIYELCVHI